MSRPFLLAALSLLLASVAAGVLTPDEPWPAGRLHVVDQAGVHVFSADPAAAPLTGLLALTGLLTPLTGLFEPNDLAFGAEGVMFVSDPGQDRVVAYDSTGALVGSVGELAEGSVLQQPTDLAFGPRGHLYVASSAADVVLRFDRSGAHDLTLGAGSGLDNPRGLAFSADGHLWVSSSATDDLLVFDASGDLLDVLSPPGLDGPHGLAFAPDGRLFVSSRLSDEIFVLDEDGEVDDVFSPGGLDAPTALAFGPDGRLYVASSGTDEVVVLDGRNGLVVGTVGPDTLEQPTGLAFSPWFSGARVAGKLARLEGDLKLKANARLSWAPGSGTVSLLLVDADPQMLTALGGDVLTFHGWEALDDAAAAFGGAEVFGRARDQGTSTLGLRVKGKPDQAGWFLPRNGRGALHRGAPGGVLDADVVTRKKLP